MRYRQLESQLHTVVGNVRLPREIQGFSPGKSFINALLSECLFVSTTPGQEAGFCFDTPDGSAPEPSDIQLTQISPAHQRSFEIANAQLPLEWEDEYGNTYSSLTLKGINLSNPGIMETSTAPDGLILYGLQESSVTERILKASQLLRENAVSTEYILGVSEPKELVVPLYEGGVDASASISIQEYKQRQIEAHWRQLPESKQTVEELARISGIIMRMSFLVTARAMDTKYRFSDILDYNKCRDDFFTYLYAKGVTAQKLSPTNKEDESKYVNEVLAPSLGKNVAKLHRLGLTHGFLHAGNITALGGIVDLDSVTGLTLYPDDTPQTPEKELADLVWCLESLKTPERAINSIFAPQNSDMSHAKTFLHNYVHERIEGLSDEETLSILGSLHMASIRNANRSPGHDVDSIVYSLISNFVSGYIVQRFKSHNYTAFHEHITELMKSSDREIADVIKQNHDTLQLAVADMFFEHIIGQSTTDALEILNKLRDENDDTRLTVAEFIGYDVVPLVINACMVNVLNKEQDQEQRAIKSSALHYMFSHDIEKWYDLITSKVRPAVSGLLLDTIDTLSLAINDAMEDRTLLDISPDQTIMSIINPGTVPLESCYVDANTLAELIEEHGLDVSLEIRQFSSAPCGNLELESGDDERIVQIISNYYIDGYTIMTDEEPPILRLDTSNMGYALVVYATNGSYRYKLYVNNDITLPANDSATMENLAVDALRSIPQSSGTPHKPTLDDYQETLFTLSD